MDPYMERDFPRDPYNDLDRRHFDEFGRRPPLDEFEGRRPPFDEFVQRRPLLERPPREHLLDDPYLRPARDPYGYPPRGETNFSQLLRSRFTVQLAHNERKEFELLTIML